MSDPTHQFAIRDFWHIGEIGHHKIAFTNSSLAMAVIVLGASWLMMMGGRSTSLVPSRWQNLPEMIYEFVAKTVRDTAGHDGMVFFPFVFSLFMFVLGANLLGMIPGSFTVTSHIVITAALALLIIAIVIIYGLYKHGTHFLGLFVPSGVPIWLLPFMVLIEIVSFLSRPLSLSLRLFGNMLAGHIALKVIAGFVAALGAAGAWAMIAPLPLALVTALTALEFLIAFLQAYVFAILTCVYLHDALHPGH